MDQPSSTHLVDIQQQIERFINAQRDINAPSSAWKPEDRDRPEIPWEYQPQQLIQRAFPIKSAFPGRGRGRGCDDLQEDDPSEAYRRRHHLDSNSEGSEGTEKKKKKWYPSCFDPIDVDCSPRYPRLQLLFQACSEVLDERLDEEDEEDSTSSLDTGCEFLLKVGSVATVRANPHLRQQQRQSSDYDVTPSMVFEEEQAPQYSSRGSRGRPRGRGMPRGGYRPGRGMSRGATSRGRADRGRESRSDLARRFEDLFGI